MGEWKETVTGTFCAQVRWAAAVVLGVTVVAAASEGRDTDAGSDASAVAVGPLVTDRPDVTESTDAVPRGRVQLEMGYTFTYDREGRARTRSHTAPEGLLRIGLFEDFELRLGWDGYTFTHLLEPVKGRTGRTVLVEDWSQGAEDASLGFKYKLAEQDGWRPHLGVIASASVPSGSAGVTSGDVDPALVFAWAYDVTERLSIAGNVGVGAPTEGSSRFVQTGASVTAAFALTERTGAYAEYFGSYPNTHHTDCAHSLNGGLTYLVSDDFQIDVRAGFGLNEEADDFFTGVGFAWRW